MDELRQDLFRLRALHIVIDETESIIGATFRTEFEANFAHDYVLSKYNIYIDCYHEIVRK